MKIALAQVDVLWEDKTGNKNSYVKYIREASEKDCHLILFPEMTLTGFSMNVELIGEEDLDTVNWFAKQAQNYNIHIGFGYVNKSECGKGKNKCVVVSPKGKILSTYTKIHPFSFGTENMNYESGSELAFCKINEFNVSTFICYDLRFPEIFQCASKKASLITVIANWPKSRREHWISLMRARAIENQCYIAAVNRIGEGNGIIYSGDSMIVDPLGNIIANQADTDKLITAELDISQVEQLRDSFKLKADRKEELYIDMFQRYN